MDEHQLHAFIARVHHCTSNRRARIRVRAPSSARKAELGAAAAPGSCMNSRCAIAISSGAIEDAEDFVSFEVEVLDVARDLLVVRLVPEAQVASGASSSSRCAAMRRGGGPGPNRPMGPERAWRQEKAYRNLRVFRCLQGWASRPLDFVGYLHDDAAPALIRATNSHNQQFEEQRSWPARQVDVQPNRDGDCLADVVESVRLMEEDTPSSSRVGKASLPLVAQQIPRDGGRMRRSLGTA